MPASSFKLLEAYGPDEKDIFYGRDPEIHALYNLLQQTRLVLVYGASGTGKTSLIQAGLPKVFKATNWFRVTVRRRDNINDSLRQELARLAPGEDSGGTTDLAQSIRKVYESRWIPLYLVFDQFEELFTLGNSHEERRVFFESIQSILENPDLPCKIILSMREEYIGYLYDYEQFTPGLFDKRFRVEPMKDNVVTGVVENICAREGIRLETESPPPAGQKSTAEQIRDQVKEGKQAAHLPYLQIYLYYLYEHARETQGRHLTFDESCLKAVGKLGDVLKKFIDSKTAEAQRHLQSRFGAPHDFAQRLLDEFATGEGTKKAHRKADLAKTLNTDDALVAEALRYFCDEAKLLRADENDVERFEPVHDVVAKQIHELRSAEDKEYKEFLRQLELAFGRWQHDKQSADRLLPEIDLNRVEIFRKRLEQVPDFRHWDDTLVAKSRSHIDTRKRNKRNTTRVLWVLTVAAVAAMITAFIFLIKARENLAAYEQADKEKKEAEALNRRNEIKNLKKKIRDFIDAEAWDLARDSIYKLEQMDSRDPDLPNLKSSVQ